VVLDAVKTSPVVVSPDGSQLAWYAGGNLELARGDGSGVRSLGSLGTGWLPSYSPDGSRLAVRVSNGVALVDVSSGATQELVSGIVEGGPEWSPDGAWIAYATEPENSPTELHVVRPDGSGDHLLASGINSSVGMSWSPDGTRLAFALEANGGSLESVDLNGVVTSYTTAAVAGPVAWSPDGGRLAFGGQPSSGGDPQLTVLRVPSGKQMVLGNGAAPAWSADGRELAFVAPQDGSVFVEPGGGGLARRLVDKVDTDWEGVLLAWTPSGRLVFAARQRTGGEAIALVSPRGGRLRFVPHTDGASAPAWSPNGRQLVFQVDDPVLDLATVEVVDADGSHLRRLAKGSSLADPSWSPDGRQIVFADENGVYEIPAGGGARRLVVRAVSPWSPVWSPDGGVIAYGSGTLVDGGVLSVVRLDGSHRRRLRADLIVGDRIDWSPDGRRIAFARTVSTCPGDCDYPELDAVRANGGGRAVLAPQMEDPSWSPDGSALAASDGTPAVWIVGPGVHRRLAPLGAQPSWQPLPGTRR
jgi:TolB protein